MRKILLIALLLAGCKHVSVRPSQPPPVGAQDHTITLSWSQSFANNGACSSTVTVSCISGFIEGYITGTSTENQLHSDAIAVCTGSTQPESCQSVFNGVVPIGNVIFYVRTTYVDQTGNPGSVGPALSPAVSVSADTAINVKVIVGP